MTTDTRTKDQIRNEWEEIAAGFDEFVTPVSMRHGEEALRRIDIRPGARFLDVGAGTGALSIPAARRGADVVAVDIAPGMVERLAARASAEGLASVEPRVMDCFALDLADEAFDVVASQNGVTMSPELRRGLSEMVRVTRPGGTVLVVAFGDPARAEFLGLFTGAVEAAVPGSAGPPTDPSPPPFQLADPEVFRRVFADAGLTGVEIETLTWDMPVASGTDLWNGVTSSNPIGARLVADLSDARRRDVREVLDGIVRERSSGRRGAVLHAEVNVGTGTKR